MIKLADLQRRLQHKRKKFEVKINDNRSTMVSVRWQPDCTKVSLHKMFLRAPENIMDHLACYLKREKKVISLEVKEFIERNLKKLDYSWQINPEKLEVQGNVYNLNKIYNRLNRDYFDNKVNLYITWFGRPRPLNRTRVTFGLYQDQLKLIKINRLMDTPTFPPYVVAYVVYHEMLHHVCPSYYDEYGKHHIHTEEFKMREQEYEYFEQANLWIKNNQGKFFRKECYGRS